MLRDDEDRSSNQRADGAVLLVVLARSFRFCVVEEASQNEVRLGERGGQREEEEEMNPIAPPLPAFERPSRTAMNRRRLTSNFRCRPKRADRRLHGETPGDSGGTSSIAPKITDAPTPPSLSMDAATNKIVKTPEADCDPIDEYCATDSKTGESIRLTVEEKERIYLDAIQSYYFNGREILSAEQFDILKEDLQWNGSPVVVLNRREAQFVSAKSAYLKGEPTMSDDEFDKLKKELKEEKSKIAVSTEPKCFIDTGICTVTLQEDEFRNNLLNLPLGIVFTLLWTIVSYEVFVGEFFFSFIFF